MGCDIHDFVEHRTPSGVWQCHHALRNEDGRTWLDDLDIPRNYALFALLAGVRGEFDFSFGERGFPEDASPPVRKEYETWASDAHTPSYLTLRELKQKALELLLFTNKQQLEVRNAQQALRKLIEQLSNLGPEEDGPPLSDEEIRLVFWFDN